MPEVTQNVSLKTYTTFKTGGLAKYLAVAKNVSELKELIKWAKKQDLPVLFLGGGSNVLVSDAGFLGLVIVLKLSEVSYKTIKDQVIVTAEAGVVFDELVKETVTHNLWGLENLSHIPGSVGATPVQNVGAYGVEVSDLIVSVEVLDMADNTIKVFTKEECQFGYRDSFFKTTAGKNFVVTAVSFELSNIPHPKLDYKDLRDHFSGQPDPELEAIRDAVIKIRSHKFPNWQKVGTAGSFFKNPIITRSHYEELLKIYPELPGFELSGERVKLPLGWILDRVCELRGYQLGNVGTYEGQALVVVNHGKATTVEIKNFADMIAEKVFAKTKIKIEWEVTLI